MALWDTSSPSSWSAGFQIKSLFLGPATHVSFYWPVVWWAVGAWTQQRGQAESGSGWGLVSKSVSQSGPLKFQGRTRLWKCLNTFKGLVQGSANYSLLAKSDSQPFSVNKNLWAHGHAHSFLYYLRLLLYYNISIELNSRTTDCIAQSLKYLLCDPSQKVSNPCPSGIYLLKQDKALYSN